MARFGRPEIFNTDQGSQFTSEEWTSTLTEAGVAISMDGKGRWIDNVFIERLWRSVKYEEVYLHAYSNGTEAREALTRYFSFYNVGARTRRSATSGPTRCTSPRASRNEGCGMIEGIERKSREASAAASRRQTAFLL